MVWEEKLIYNFSVGRNIQNNLDGHLNPNKVAAIVDKLVTIHSVLSYNITCVYF